RFEQLDGQRTDRVLAEDHDGERAGQAEGHGDRHTDEHQREENNKQEQDGHYLRSSVSSCCARCAASAASSARPRPVCWPRRMRAKMSKKGTKATVRPGGTVSAMCHCMLPKGRRSSAPICAFIRVATHSMLDSASRPA